VREAESVAVATQTRAVELLRPRKERRPPVATLGLKWSRVNKNGEHVAGTDVRKSMNCRFPGWSGPVFSAGFDKSVRQPVRSARNGDAKKGLLLCRCCATKRAIRCENMQEFACEAHFTGHAIEPMFTRL
jgi:hypothetical protein